VSYQVFARKYRPQTFEDVLGQDHVIQTLKNAISQDRLAHAYLFVGPRGTGKTSTARIFAKALNCTGGPKVDFDPDEEVCKEIADGISLDVLEIDGASNNGVEQVRELRETVKFAPARGRFKIYYIDEVHMLTTAAFNALLKTLEEPPPHVKFIFATTEPNKILPTIISRCQRFDLRRIPTQVIADHLLYIAKEEGVKLEEKAAYSIAKGADGGMRDAESMLDQLVAFCGDKISEENVLEIFGFSSLETIADITQCLFTHKSVPALELIHQQSEKGKDLSRLLDDVISYLRNVLVASVDPNHKFEELAPEIAARVKEQSASVEADRLLSLIDHFAQTETKMKWAPNKRLHLEIAVIKAVQILTETTISDVIGILSQAEPIAAKLPASSTGAAKAAAPAKKKSEPALTSAPEESSPEPAAQAEVAPEPFAAEPEPVAAPIEDAEPEPPAAQEEEAEPEDEELPDDSQPRKGAELWERVIYQIAKERPLLSAWASGAVYRDEYQKSPDKTFVIAFSPGNSFAKDSLMQDARKAYIEELLKKFSGASLTLVCETKDDVPEPEPVDLRSAEFDEEPEPGAEPEPPGADGDTPPWETKAEAAPAKVEEPPPAPAAPQEEAKAPEPEPEPEPEPAEPKVIEEPPEVDPEEFLQDPLIKDALTRFEAKIEQQGGGK